MTVKRIEHATYLDALLVGVGQLIAILPGLGAAAVGMTLARMLGYERTHATRFYFLLSIPVMLGFIARDGYKITAAGVAVGGPEILACVAVFFSALLGIAILQAWLRRSTFTPFVIYRLLLGGAVLALAYGLVSV
jgi:undecaprenyl-diphosphatase